MRMDVDERLRRLAAGWSPTPVAPPEAQAPAEPLAAMSAGHWSRRSWRAFALLLGAIALGGVWLWWQGQPREVTQIAGSSALPNAVSPVVGGEVVVHVGGAVKKPGLIRLASGSRVADAIEKAGGAKSLRVLESVNLARVLVDGEQIILGQSAAAIDSGKISLTTATAAELEQLPGVGQVLAQRIVQHRVDHGPFRNVDDVNEVSGVGDALMDDIRPLVTP